MSQRKTEKGVDDSSKKEVLMSEAVRQAMKEALCEQDHKHLLISNSVLRNILCEKGFDVTWDQVADWRYELRHELSSKNSGRRTRDEEEGID